MFFTESHNAWSIAALAAAALLGGAGLIAARKTIRDTTLTATWWWCVASFVAAIAIELLLDLAWRPSHTTAEAMRYASRCLLVCPGISLLGAKRPQDGPWNFVVVSLWGILALPAAEAVWLKPGQGVQVYWFREWLLLALLTLGFINTLLTSRWLAALVTTAGQWLLLDDYLPISFALGAWATPVGLLALAAAALLYSIGPTARGETTLDRLWLDFRDMFGLLWTLRVHERLHAAAKLAKWDITPTWTGWVNADGTPLQNEPPREQLQAILVTYRGLLRRFVSNAWINERITSEATTTDPI